MLNCIDCCSYYGSTLHSPRPSIEESQQPIEESQRKIEQTDRLIDQWDSLYPPDWKTLLEFLGTKIKVIYLKFWN